MSTNTIAQKIFNSLGLSKQKETDHFKKSVSIEIEKIRNTQAQYCNDYEKAGFRANNITAKIVQKQIATRAQ